MSSDVVTVKKVEEKWTPTTIHAVFTLGPLSGNPKSGGISIDLPLLKLGWTFTLLLVPESLGTRANEPAEPQKWFPAGFAFRQYNVTIPWGKTSMRAELSLPVRQPGGCADISCTSCNPPQSMTMTQVILADTPSVETPGAASSTVLLHSSIKVSLNVTISECPFSDGLFEVHANEAGAKAWFVRQSDDRLLSQSFATGKIYDVKFLTFPARSTPGRNGQPLETYASLSALEGHVNPSFAKLGEGWSGVLAALNRPDNADARHRGEISCPDGYEYELDSDFDEDETAFLMEPCVSTPPVYIHLLETWTDQRLESSPERPSNSLSSLELASDLGFVDSLHEEVVKSAGEPHRSSPVARTDHEQTVLIKFAAHRTWRAFLWYCYTGRLEFNKLKSQVDRDIGRRRAGDGPPACSPKSMYRLADLVGDAALRATALAAIKERMTEVNVLDETFSIFASKYPEAREVQLDVLMKHCASAEVKGAFLRSVLAFSNMPHAKPALEAFYDRLVSMK